jgi:hypothetical protein
MRTCIFCAQAADSEEHPIALWLIERMQVDTVPIRVGKRTASDIEARTAHLLRNLSVRKVCGSCNNGWISALETWFQQAGGFLVEPNWPKLADTIISNVQGDFLAKWALKTVIMLDQAGLTAPVISASFANDLFNALDCPALGHPATVRAASGTIALTTANDVFLDTVQRGPKIFGSVSITSWIKKHGGTYRGFREVFPAIGRRSSGQS